MAVATAVKLQKTVVNELTKHTASVIFLHGSGGFSMGGGMAIHLAYRFLPHVAGVFALSSFLNKGSICYQVLQEYSGPLPELFQCHGESDDLILHQWGEETNKELKALGVPSSFHSFPDLAHELHKAELEMLKSWILQKLPEVVE